MANGSRKPLVTTGILPRAIVTVAPLLDRQAGIRLAGRIGTGAA
jgi:hypothetical protein